MHADSPSGTYKRKYDLYFNEWHIFYYNCFMSMSFSTTLQNNFLFCSVSKCWQKVSTFFVHCGFSPVILCGSPFDSVIYGFEWNFRFLHQRGLHLLTFLYLYIYILSVSTRVLPVFSVKFFQCFWWFFIEI